MKWYTLKKECVVYRSKMNNSYYPKKTNSEVKQMAYHFNTRMKIYKEVSSGPLPGADGEEVIVRPWADIKTLERL